MKAIIYAGIGLFSVATVYGLADYYSSQKKGTLDKLYAEEEPVTPPAVEDRSTAVIPEKAAEVIPAETESVKVSSTKKAKRPAEKKIKMEDFSRARIPEPPVDEPILDVREEKKEPVSTEPAVVEPVSKIATTDGEVRKLTLDKYSRAPLKKRVKKVTVESKEH